MPHSRTLPRRQAATGSRWAYGDAQSRSKIAWTVEVSAGSSLFRLLPAVLKKYLKPQFGHTIN